MFRFISVIFSLLVLLLVGASYAEEKGLDPAELLKVGKLVPIINLYEAGKNCSKENSDCVKYKDEYYRKSKSSPLTASTPLSIKAGQLVEVSFRNNDAKDYYCYIVKRTGGSTGLMNREKFIVAAGKMTGPLTRFLIDTPDTIISWYLSDIPVNPLRFDLSSGIRGGIVIVPSIDVITGK